MWSYIAAIFVTVTWTAEVFLAVFAFVGLIVVDVTTTCYRAPTRRRATSPASGKPLGVQTEL